MNARRTDQLTEAQRECLRLVISHHNSKEIAVLMGVSPSAIDKRIERAVQILGATSRFEAARTLSDEERDARLGDSLSTYERLPSDAIDLPPTSEDRSEPGHAGPWGLVRRFLGLISGGDQDGAARIRGTRIERLVQLVLITVGIAVASVAAVSLLMTVTSMLRASRG